MVSGLFDHLHVTYLIIYLCVNLGYVNFLHRKPTRAAQSKQQWWVKPIEHAQPEGRLNGWWCSWEGFLYGTLGMGVLGSLRRRTSWWQARWAKWFNPLGSW